MTDECRDLWDRARRAVETAASLVQTDPDAAASRAYYAAFYAVTALLVSQGASFSKHSAVEAAVHRDLVKAGRWAKELGTDFSFLRDLRSTADYGGGIHVPAAEALEAVEAARRIVRAAGESGNF